MKKLFKIALSTCGSLLIISHAEQIVKAFAALSVSLNFILKDDQKASADFDRVLKHEYIDLIDYGFTAHYSDFSKDYEKAIADLNRAIQLNPELADAYNNRGYIYFFELKDYQKALADFNQILKLNPNDAQAYKYRGIAYLKLKDYQGAIANYTQALKPQSAIDDPDFYALRGIAYSDLKDYPRAIADYTQALKLNPIYNLNTDVLIYNPDIYALRSIAYFQLKDYQKAIADLQKAAQSREQLGNTSLYILNYQQIQQLLKYVEEMNVKRVSP